MKKIFTIATIIGLVAVPSAVFAEHGSDDGQRSVAPVVQQQRQDVDNEQNEHQADQAQDRVDNDQNDDRNAPVVTTTPPTTQPVTGTAVTLAQAEAIAQSQLPGKTISRVQQENEEGIAVFSVRFSDGSRVDVAVSSGNVTRVDNQTNNNNSGNGNSNNDNSGRGHDGDNHRSDNDGDRDNDRSDG